jgi:hypothetical protein
MDTYKLDVNIKLYFVLFDEKSNSFMVYLEDNGEIPSIKLSKEDEIKKVILDKSLSLFYKCGAEILNACKLSDIKKVNDSIEIIYNIYCYDGIGDCKSGKFVSFNKESIELFRFARNRGNNG